MKILLLVSSLDAGGTERVAVSLSNAWCARGDTVTLVPTFSGGGQPFYEVADAVELIYLADMVGSRQRNLLNYGRRLLALRRLIATRRPDVLVSFLPNVNVAAILSAAFLRIPLIIGERSDPSSYPPEGLVSALCKLTYRFADMLTVQTDAVAAKVGRLYPGLRAVRAIANPLAPGVMSHARREQDGRRILLSMGRLSSEKQTDKLIAVFAALAPAFADWDLHIYGDGPMKTMLEAQVERANLQGRVQLKAATRNPWQVMAAADAFVMVSRYEGFPNALLEAMAVGLPCVVFDCPSGPREITHNGSDALLVPLDDMDGLVVCLRRVMADPQLRASLGERARESVRQRFTLQQVVAGWDRLFAEVQAARLRGAD